MNTYSTGFGRNQIKRYIKRLLEQEMREIKAKLQELNYNDYIESDTYSDK